MAFFTTVIYTTLEEAFVKEYRQEIEVKLDNLSRYIEENLDIYYDNEELLFKYIRLVEEESGIKISIVDLNHDIGNEELPSNIDAETFVEDQEGNPVLHIYSVSESTIVKDLISHISDKVVYISVGTILGLAIIVFLITGFITNPIHRMLKIIDKMANGKFDEKVKVKGHDELAELAMAFNQMSAKLQKIDANRQEFVSNVSHELKTPLSSMKVLIESMLLQEDISRDVYKEFLADTNSEIDRLTEIINHLLMLVKLDIKVLPLTLEVINLNQMMDGIVKRLSILASKKNIELKIIEEKDEVIAEIDKIKMTLAISNLIENGIKYTDDGCVEVKIDSDHQNAYITVTDTGVGIAEEEQNKIFDRFYRIDKTRDRETGGTGLGLSITHRAVLLHEGSIKVISEEGKGTSFVVRIPIKQNKDK